jgi:hypothetical protein
MASGSIREPEMQAGGMEPRPHNCYASLMKPIRDIDLGHQFPVLISLKSRAKVARLGILFVAVQVAAILLLAFL